MLVVGVGIGGGGSDQSLPEDSTASAVLGGSVDLFCAVCAALVTLWAQTGWHENVKQLGISAVMLWTL